MCVAVKNVKNLVNLTHLELHAGSDPLTNISCYETLFLPLVNLKVLSIGFRYFNLYLKIYF